MQFKIITDKKQGLQSYFVDNIQVDINTFTDAEIICIKRLELGNNMLSEVNDKTINEYSYV